MTHVGKELTLCQVRRLCRLLGGVKLGSTLKNPNLELLVGSLEDLLAAFRIIDIRARTDPLHNGASFIAKRL
ncbi:MAG: hypothetical protein ACO1QR_03055, partial [Chthoniobacteraceae bacterium]